MSKALLEQFVQVHGLELKPEFFRRCQREFRDYVLPMYDEIERLKAENDNLKALTARLEKRKHASDAVGAA